MAFGLKQAVQALVDGKKLTRNQSVAAMKEIMGGKSNESLIAAYLIELRIRG